MESTTLMSAVKPRDLFLSLFFFSISLWSGSLDFLSSVTKQKKHWVVFAYMHHWKTRLKHHKKDTFSADINPGKLYSITIMYHNVSP